MAAHPKLKTIAASCALALFAAAGANEGMERRADQASDAGAHVPSLTQWNAERLYTSGWSANQLIGAEVRGANGEEIGEVKDIIVDRDGYINKVVAEVGGFLEIGDQHIGVPWQRITMGPDLEFIQVPLQEVENGTYSLFGRVPQGEEVVAAPTSWRVNELIGDFASLTDVPRYGLVSDVIFDAKGKAQAVVVDRNAGPWGGYGRFAYPYAGYRADAWDYGLPYATNQLVELEPFDYARLSAMNRQSNGPLNLGGTSGAAGEGMTGNR